MEPRGNACAICDVELDEDMAATDIIYMAELEARKVYLCEQHFTVVAGYATLVVPIPIDRLIDQIQEQESIEP